MTGPEFREICLRLYGSVYAAAPSIGVSLRQAYRYAKGDQPVPDTVQILLNLQASQADTEYVTITEKPQS